MRIFKREKNASEKKMLLGRMRNIPLGKCYFSKSIHQSAGEGVVIITRQHKNGDISLATFYIDTYCLGLTESSYQLHISPKSYEENFVNDFLCDFDEVGYEEAHSYIYGVIAFAREAGIPPHFSFHLTQFFLKEKRNGTIAPKEKFGRNGIHFLIAHSQKEADKFLPILKKNLGNDFDYLVPHKEDSKETNESEEEDFYKDLSNITPKDINAMVEKRNLLGTFGELTPYNYRRPHYPDSLHLHHHILKQKLFTKGNIHFPEPEEIRNICALPQETLREDLEQIILYSLALTENMDFEQLKAEGVTSAFINAVLFLGEIGDKNSLDIILEILRQSETTSEKLLGDLKEEIILPTVYTLGKDHLNCLMDFAKEPGLFTYLHYMVYPAVSLVTTQTPGRRPEVIDWYRVIIRFVIQELPNNRIVDATMAAFIICELVDIKASELLTEIKELFDTKSVDLGFCGKYEEVENEIIHPGSQTLTYNGPLDIYGRCTFLEQLFQQDLE